MMSLYTLVPHCQPVCPCSAFLCLQYKTVSGTKQGKGLRVALLPSHLNSMLPVFVVSTYREL